MDAKVSDFNALSGSQARIISSAHGDHHDGHQGSPGEEADGLVIDVLGVGPRAGQQEPGAAQQERTAVE